LTTLVARAEVLDRQLPGVVRSRLGHPAEDFGVAIDGGARRGASADAVVDNGRAVAVEDDQGSEQRAGGRGTS